MLGPLFSLRNQQLKIDLRIEPRLSGQVSDGLAAVYDFADDGVQSLALFAVQ